MANFRVFIEGDGSEKRFLQYFIDYIKPDNRVDLITVGGWNNLEFIKSQFEENTDNDGINIVVFDADDNVKDSNHGGFEARTLKINQVLQNYSFELFLYPNNQNDGDFESLLEKIINKQHKVILECFDNYENCLSNYMNEETGNNEYKLPLRKSKMYAYVDAFPKSKKQNEEFKKGEFFFKNKYMWDFNDSNLYPLRDFLLKILNGTM